MTNFANLLIDLPIFCSCMICNPILTFYYLFLIGLVSFLLLSGFRYFCGYFFEFWFWFYNSFHNLKQFFYELSKLKVFFFFWVKREKFHWTEHEYLQSMQLFTIIKELSAPYTSASIQMNHVMCKATQTEKPDTSKTNPHQMRTKSPNLHSPKTAAPSAASIHHKSPANTKKQQIKKSAAIQDFNSTFKTDSKKKATRRLQLNFRKQCRKEQRKLNNKTWNPQKNQEFQKTGLRYSLLAIIHIPYKGWLAIAKARRSERPSFIHIASN